MENLHDNTNLGYASTPNDGILIYFGIMFMKNACLCINAFPLLKYIKHLQVFKCSGSAIGKNTCSPCRVCDSGKRPFSNPPVKQRHV